MQDKRRVFIIGASDFGREIEGWLELTPHNQRDWYIAGYLDRNSNALKGCQSDYDVVGEEDSAEGLGAESNFARRLRRSSAEDEGELLGDVSIALSIFSDFR